MSPTAIRFLKHSFNADTDHQGGIGNMAAAGLDLFVESDEGREGALAFTEKRTPDFATVCPMSVTLDLADRVAVVTGAASGIGRAIALTLTEAGATVAAVDRNGAGVSDTVTQIGGASTAHVADLTDPGAIRALRDEVIDTHRAPDVLVNAAGWDRIEPFMDNDDQLWQDLTAINLLGPVRVSHAFLQPIIAAGTPAKIVNIASDAGRVGSSGETVYAGTKGGVIAFTKSLARELARHGSTSTASVPGQPTRRCSRRCPSGSVTASSGRSRFGASPSRRRSPTPSCSSRPTARGTSPGRC